MTTATIPADAWHVLPAQEVTARLGTDVEHGLSASTAAARLERHGPNKVPGERAASVWQVALGQFADPMTAMLVVVAGVSSSSPSPPPRGS